MDALWQLSRGQLADVLELVHSTVSVKNDTDIQTLLRHVSELVPSRHAACCLKRIGSDGRIHNSIKQITFNFPAAWLTQSGNFSTDLIARLLGAEQENFKAQLWSSILERHAIKEHREPLDKAKLMGLSQGLTLHGAAPRHRLLSLFSFAGDGMGDDPRYSAIVEYITPFLHLALLRSAFAVNTETPLSTREQEILSWVSKGKTNWEIARILGISERTAKFHVRNILEKLEASSRSHAVAIAIERHLLES